MIRLSARKTYDDRKLHSETFRFLRTLRDEGDLTDWNQVAFLFRSVKNDKVVALARFLESKGYSRLLTTFEHVLREGRNSTDDWSAHIPVSAICEIRQWADEVHLPIWDYYDQACFKAFTDELRRPENSQLLEWARPLAKRHLNLAQNTDYAFSGLFYQLLQFSLFSRSLPKKQ